MWYNVLHYASDENGCVRPIFANSMTQRIFVRRSQLGRYSKFQNDWTIETEVIDDWDFARFEFKMGFGRISYIEQHPRDNFTIQTKACQFLNCSTLLQHSLSIVRKLRWVGVYSKRTICRHLRADYAWNYTAQRPTTYWFSGHYGDVIWAR